MKKVEPSPLPRPASSAFEPVSPIQHLAASPRVRTQTWIGYFVLLAVVAVPYPIGQLLPLPVAIALATFIYLIGISFSAVGGAFSRPLLLSLLGGPALWAVALLMQQVLGLSAFGGAFLYFFVVPLGILAGIETARNGLVPSFLSAFRITAAILALLATIEFAMRRSAFGYETFLQNDVIRATAGQFHPIILGVILTAAIGASAELVSRRLKVALIALLFIGIVTTGSLGPIVVGAVIAVFAIFPGIRKTSRWTTLAVAAFALAGGFLSTTVWSTDISGGTVDEYSSGYRTAVYALLPNILRSAPFGYGPSGLPPGSWLIYSQYLGIRDVSVTVDAEPVLLAAEWGFLGLIAFSIVLWVSGRALYRGFAALSLTLVGLTLNGLTVALHAWLNLSIFWMILIGMAVWAVFQARHSEPVSASPSTVLDRS
ncbi:hypothetical protein WDJ51_09105 [Rathayibacter sp. YIM 133350]|uniref:O-antigen ligase family protein n=1 Tax=Rathayibacter sp. YIM 133350 TaxID=3131992 RepID=UPI00307DA406